MTRGELCNNVVDLMTFRSITWDGEIKPTRDPDGRLCTFKDVVDSIRAGAVNLLSYYFKDKRDTMAAVIERYANDKVDNNNTAAYIAFMCTHCNVKENDTLVLNNAPFLNLVMGGIIRFEMGSDFCTPAQIAQGVSEALQHVKAWM